MSTMTLKDMTCANCANEVSVALHSVEGVRNFDVDLSDQIAVITYDDDETSDTFIRSTIEKVNCKAH
ncbi:heavy-metal-associated domain-containing protein [Alicyclobacillus fodiniaquatilis]|uniref:Heavy-metal-associated domain-containing protein n=1 Tax=Alicyclobacillus fodiniaquatilis TaxID=1661150 RepID=A0ABW4JPG9_9BACL